jgi:hypothetical protein
MWISEKAKSLVIDIIRPYKACKETLRLWAGVDSDPIH